MEKVLKTYGYEPLHYYAPSYLAKGCNSALKVSMDALDFVIEQQERQNIDIYRVYTAKNMDGTRVYEVLKEF